MAEAVCENCKAKYKLNGKIPKFTCICQCKNFKVKN